MTMNVERVAALEATIRNLQRDIEQLMLENDQLFGTINEVVEKMRKVIE